MDSTHPMESALLADLGFLRRLAWSLTRDHSRADDLVQDAAMIAVTRAPDDLAAPRAWFRRIIENLSRNARRSTTRRKLHEDRPAARAGALTPEQHAMRREILEAVVAEVLRLEEPFGSVVMLRFYDGLAPREISKRLGIADGTTRSRLSRGLAILRTRLDGRVGSRDRWATLIAPLGLASGGLSAGLKVAAVAAVLVLLATPMISKTMPLDPAGARASLPEAQRPVEPSAPPGTEVREPRSGPPPAADAASALAPDSAAQDSGSAPVDAAPAPIRGVVIDSATQQPVAGARISWIVVDLCAPQHPARLAWWDEAGERALIGAASSVTSAADGAFEIPGTPRRILAIASDGRLWGMLKGSPSGPATIQVAPDRSDWLEVRSRDGRPEGGVPVVVKRLGGPAPIVVWRGVTGADGVAEVRHAQRVRTTAQRAALTYGIDVPGVMPVEPPLADGSARVKLDLPPTAALRVVVHRPGQLAFGRGARVALRAATAPSEDRGLDATTDDSGVVTFAHVAPNADYVVEVRDPTWQFRDAPAVRAKTSDAGGSTTVVAAFAEPAPALLLRALDAGGKPLGGRAIVRANAGAPEAGEPECFMTDADGVVRIPIASATEIDLVAPTAAGPGSVGARVSIPPSAAGAGTEARTVTFSELPVLVRGRIKSDDAAAAAGVNLAASREAPGARAAWAADPGLLARTAPDGTFVLRGLANGRKLAIRSPRASFGADVTRVDEGASGIEIPLGAPAARVRVAAAVTRGTLLLDSSIPLDLVRASLRRRAHAGSPVTHGPVTVVLRQLPAARAGAVSAEFAFSGLEPGKYDFTVDSVGGSDPVITSTFHTSKASTTFGGFGGFDSGVPIFEGPEIELGAGSSAGALLEGVDLRGKLRTVAALIVDGAGTPISGAEATVLSSDVPGRKLGGGTSNAQGRFVVVTSLGSHRLAVRAPGCRTSVIPLDALGASVNLRRGIPVRLVVRAADGGTAPDNLVAQLEWTADPASKLPPISDEQTAIAWLPDEGRVPLVDLSGSVFLPAPGHYRASLATLAGGAAGKPGWYIGRHLATEDLEVRDTDTEQTFEIAIKTATPKPRDVK